MQIDKETILSNPDPLSLACHPLEKIKFITDVFLDNPETGQKNIMTAMEMLEDTKAEIELIINASSEKWNRENEELERLRKENDKLKELLEQGNRLDQEKYTTLSQPSSKTLAGKIPPAR